MSKSAVRGPTLLPGGSNGVSNNCAERVALDKEFTKGKTAKFE
jgi:hypothetical protein